MGMFDTIHFEKPIACAVCQAEIPSIQTKAFDCALDDFRIGDCIGHAEEIRIVRESLYCTACLTASVCGHWRRTLVSRRLPSRASLMVQARLVRKWRFVWPRPKALGRSPESWLAMQHNYDLWQARKVTDLSHVRHIELAA